MAAGGYGLLGPVEVRVDGRALPLPGARQRLLLAMLLVNANRMVPAVRLIDELWGADLPADPRAALRTHIARLRRALGPAGGDLATLEGGYRLTVPRGRLDVCRFEDALAEAARVGAEPALRLLDEALALCRGPALGEFADRPFALATAARLEELRVTAAERQAGLQLSLGQTEEAVAALQALLAEHPEREQARGLLMQALYRAGRHTEALATIRSWRRHLATDLGLDPSPALQAIELDILRHTAGTPDTRGAAATRALPLPVTSFVGRDEDLVAVTGRLDRARLVTLHGPGGVGKTRLALEVAERTGGSYRDGICFCDLAAVTEPHAVVRAVATAAGLSERAFRRLHGQRAGREPAGQVRAADRRTPGRWPPSFAARGGGLVLRAAHPRAAGPVRPAGGVPRQLRRHCRRSGRRQPWRSGRGHPPPAGPRRPLPGHRRAGWRQHQVPAAGDLAQLRPG